MKITALEEYGLRCVLRLARTPQGGPLTVAEIAAAEGLTVPYVGKLMSVLRQSSLVASVRGRSGGYALCRPATDISVEEVLNVLGEPLFSAAYCGSHPGSLAICTHQVDCSIRSIWQVLGDVIHFVLRRTSLADLCQQEGALSRNLEESTRAGMLATGIPGWGQIQTQNDAAVPGAGGVPGLRPFPGRAR